VPLYTFLSALPALLALAGFVLYQILGANKSGDEVSRRIVEKLRTGAPNEFRPDHRLNATQIARLLEGRQRLIEIVGEHDFHLLKQALTQQFVITILVYLLGLGFCGWSVYMFVQQPARPLSISPQTVQTSSGDQSPNVTSSGSGSVTVQTGAPAKQSTTKPGALK
jgi:hypothetical protein